MPVPSRPSAVVALALLACGMAGTASAAAIVDISSGFDFAFSSSFSGYDALPYAGSTITIRGIDFKLGGSGYASVVAPTYSGPPVVTFSFGPVAVTNKIYTLMNEFGGNDYLTQTLLGYPNNTGTIGFNFGNGTTYSYTLRSGIDIRNYQGTAAGAPDFGTSNSVVYGSAIYGAANNYHFDAQEFDLPEAFQNLTLTGITLTDINPDYSGHDIGGAPFLLALSVGTPVPEPATWAMVVGVGIVGVALRRRRFLDRSVVRG